MLARRISHGTIGPVPDSTVDDATFQVEYVIVNFKSRLFDPTTFPEMKAQGVGWSFDLYDVEAQRMERNELIAQRTCKDCSFKITPVGRAAKLGVEGSQIKHTGSLLSSRP